MVGKYLGLSRDTNIMSGTIFAILQLRFISALDKCVVSDRL